MFTNKQSLYLTGVVTIGIFIAGFTNVLNFLIVKIILGSVFVLVILNLFIIKKEPELIKGSENNNL